MNHSDQLMTSDAVVNLASDIFIRHGKRLTFEQSLQLARDIFFYPEDDNTKDETFDPSATFWDGAE